MVDTFLLLSELLFSALLGGLVGLEREFNRKLKKSIPIGVRTMILITVFGTLAVSINDYVMIVGLIGIILLSGLSFYARYRDYDEKGLTTYTAALIMYFAGVMVGYGNFLIAVAIAVVTAGLLSMSSELHNLAFLMNRKELKSAILFALIAFIILPLLPNKTIDFLGLFNPFNFWLLVVIISALSFTSYLLLKLTPDGLAITGLLGGFINANSTIYQLLEHNHNTDALNGVLLSAASSIISVLLIILFGTFNLYLLSGLIFPLFFSTGLILFFFIKKVNKESVNVLKINSPFNLTNALRIAFLIFIIMKITYLFSYLISDSMVYASIAVSAFFSSFATTATIVSMHSSGLISNDLTINLVLLTVIMSLFNRLLIIRLAGGKKCFKKLLPPFLLWNGLIISYFVFLKLSTL